MILIKNNLFQVRKTKSPFIIIIAITITVVVIITFFFVCHGFSFAMVSRGAHLDRKLAQYHASEGMSGVRQTKNENKASRRNRGSVDG